MTSENMYVDEILDHYKHPRNHGKLPDANAASSDVNVACGDSIEMRLLIENDKIAEVSFMGAGCAISQAAASILTEAIKGKTLGEIKAMTKDDMVTLLGVPVSAARIKCALLAYKVMKMAVYRYMGEKLEEDD